MLIFFLISAYVGAHSYLQQSNPGDGEVVEDIVRSISLTFDGGIESSSVIEIFRSNGEEVPLQELIVDSPYIEATFVEPLDTDDYRLNWLVIGDDGHPTDGTIVFSVISPEIVEEENIDDENVNEEEAMEEEVDEVVEETETELNGNEEIDQDQIIKEENKDQSFNILLIGLIFLAFIIALFVFSKRKR